MKNFLQIVLFFLCINFYGQNAREIKVSHKKITEATNIAQIINDIPADCKVQSFIFTGSVSGALKEFSCTGDEFSKELKSVMAKKQKGEWFFVEHLKTNCEKSHKSSYKIIID